MAVLAFGGVGIAVVLSGGSTPPSAPGAGSPKQAAGNSPSAASPSPSASAATTVAPRVLGWQGVASARYKMAYDAPESWKVNDPGTHMGFAKPSAGIYVIMHSSSMFLTGFCSTNKGLSRAAAGFTGYDDADPIGTVATNAARQWAIGRWRDNGGREPALALSRPRQLEVDGISAAVHVTARATVHSGHKCDPRRGVVHAIAMPGRGDSKYTVLVIWADQGVASAPTNTDIRKMIGSLRPAT